MSDEVKKADPVFSLSEFLESHPPNQLVNVSDLGERKFSQYNGEYYDLFTAPEIQLHCSNEKCNGLRVFRFTGKEKPIISHKDFDFLYITYRCNNCLKEDKTYSLALKMDSQHSVSGGCYKFGELPNFGPPTPAKLIKLIGPDRDAFLKGRRCENQGLGIGAFIYYRRVVENQKDRILGQIIKVSEKIGADQSKINVLHEAVKETQFSTALKNTKGALPESLLIDGHNPLLLLHSALSEGVHAMSDEQCLAIAGSVRVVLGELSERLGQALKDEAELSQALSTLINHKNG